MYTNDEIPNVWLDVSQVDETEIDLLEFEHEPTVKCALYVIAEYDPEIKFDFSKANCSFKITKFLISEVLDLASYEANALFALVSQIEISEEDWKMYQDGYDIRFNSPRPVPVIIYKSSVNQVGGATLSMLGSGLVDEEFIKLTRNFL